MDNKPRRRTKRIECNLPVQWIRRGIAQPAVARDLNAHGLFIATELDAQPMELLQIVIQLPDGPITACVIARFVGKSESGKGVGAELFTLSEADRRRWNRFYRAALRSMGAPIEFELNAA